MNFSIIGQGAIGLLWYSHLLLDKQQVSLLCSSRTKQFPKDVTFESLDGQIHQLPLQQITSAQLLHADVIIICLKSYDMLPALKQYQPYISDDTTVILCHNGIVDHQAITQLLSTQTVLCLLTTHGSQKITDFSIRHTGKGSAQLGYISKQQAPLFSLTEKLNHLLPSVNWQDNIRLAQWQKLAINCVINPLTAIDNVENGALLQPKYQPVIRDLCREIVTVAELEKIPLHKESLINNVLNVAKLTASNCSSMRADIVNHRTTEIEHINGFIVHLAAKHQMKVPENLALYEKIIQLQS